MLFQEVSLNEAVRIFAGIPARPFRGIVWNLSPRRLICDPLGFSHIIQLSAHVCGVVTAAFIRRLYGKGLLISGCICLQCRAGSLTN
jgi:hypothetical protein